MNNNLNTTIEEKEKELKSLRQQKRNNQLLTLKDTELRDLKVGTRKDGKKYSVRSNRMRVFFPDEWMKFFDTLKPSQKITFDFLVNTGTRIQEAQNVEVGDIDWKRNTIIIRVTKIKAVKGEKNPKPRTIVVSSQFIRRLKKYLTEKGLLSNNYEKIRLLSTPAAHICLKKVLKKINIKDWYMFSIHNIRKTHGTYLNALGVSIGEICLRLGHDMNTFLKDYGSSDIYNYNDKKCMRLILGDLYQELK